MANRNRSAIDIELLGIDAKLIAAINHLHGERLVQLPEIDVVDRQTVALEQAWYRKHWTDAHFVWLATGRDEPPEYAEGFQPLLRRELVTHNHRRARPVRQLARVAAGDSKARPFCRFYSGKSLRCRVRSRPLIRRQGNVLVGHNAGRLVCDCHRGLDRCQFVVEAAALLSRRGATLALQTVLVLTLAGDVVSLGDDLGRVQHRNVSIALYGQQLGIDGMKHVHLVVLYQTDGFASAANRNLDAIEDHRACGQSNGLKARCALTVDGCTRRRYRQSRPQQCLPCDVGPGGALLHRAAHNHVLNLGAFDLGTRQCCGNSMTQHGRAFGVVERAFVGLADRRAGGRDDNSFSHSFTSGWMPQRFQLSWGVTNLICACETHEMVGGVAELNIDGKDSLEVMADIKLVAYSHAAVKLHRLLADKPRGIADFC